MVKFYIDPGHGGSDPGAIGNGFREADLALRIGLELRRILLEEYEGAEVRMSRTTDNYLTLTQRTNDANNWGAHYFVSIHLNSASASAKGFESYVYNRGVDSKTLTLQSNIHSAVYNRIKNDLGYTVDRGKKQANFAVLRQTSMPAVLTENLFINSTHDGSLIKKSNYVAAIARGHAEGLAKIAGLKKKEVAPTTGSFTSTGSFTYTVVAGDTLWGIAKRFGTTVDKIKADNNLSSNTIVVGKKLIINSNDIIHTVVSGDTLWGIARKYGTTVDKIKAANGLTSNVIQPGDKLVIKK